MGANWFVINIDDGSKATAVTKICNLMEKADDLQSDQKFLINLACGKESKWTEYWGKYFYQMTELWQLRKVEWSKIYLKWQKIEPLNSQIDNKTVN